MRPRNSIPHHQLISLLPFNHAAITQAVERLGPCTTEHVLQQLELPVTRANEMIVAKHLRRLGFTKARLRIQGIRTYVFYPPAG